jgi:argininosuccinate lyase
MSYARDLQEDKEALFDAARTVRSALRALTVAVESLELRVERAAERAAAGYSTATDLADHLVRAGVPFRTAYDAVKRLVLDCAAAARPLEALSPAELQRYHPALGPAALAAGRIERALAARDVPGGTAPARVAAALARASARLAEQRRQWAALPTLASRAQGTEQGSP